MMTDPIADLLIQIKNGYLAGKKNISLPHSTLRQALLELLKDNGYIGKTHITIINKSKKAIEVELIYINKKPKLTHTERISKPSRKVYVSRKNIPNVLGGMGIAIISTPKGLMTGSQAKKMGLGGELICKIW